MFTKVILYISGQFLSGLLHTIAYHILMYELCFLVWNPWYLIGLSQSFLTNRTQALCIGNTLSEGKHTYGDIPQVTKMGVPLFSI